MLQTDLSTELLHTSATTEMINKHTNDLTWSTLRSADEELSKHETPSQNEDLKNSQQVCDQQTDESI